MDFISFHPSYGFRRSHDPLVREQMSEVRRQAEPKTDPKEMTERIRGVLAPVVTPFKGDLSPDTECFIAH
jgi:hypothetical protein